MIGFAPSYLREQLAAAFYTDVYDPGCGGIYDPRETRHVVQINLGLLEPLGIEAGNPEFPIEHVESDVARAMSSQSSSRLRAAQSGSSVAEQTVAGIAVRPVAAALRESSWLDVRRIVGRRRARPG